MFTIKLYSTNGFRQRILEATSFTILRHDTGEAEITLHRRDGDDVRYDLRVEPTLNNRFEYEGPERFGSAIIENAAGKTTEMIRLPSTPASIQA